MLPPAPPLRSAPGRHPAERTPFPKEISGQNTSFVATITTTTEKKKFATVFLADPLSVIFYVSPYRRLRIHVIKILAPTGSTTAQTGLPALSVSPFLGDEALEGEVTGK